MARSASAEPADSRRRRVNGEGSIYQRASDGKWVGSAYVFTTAGVRRRKVIYGNSFDEVRQKLDRLRGNSANGVLVPDGSTSVAEYLDYWLREVASHRRVRTAEGYRGVVENHIVPVLGGKRLDRLTGADVRTLLAVCRQKCVCCVKGLDRKRPPEDQCCSVGNCCKRTPSKRQIQYIHAVLRNALANAEREELITRNVAKLVKIPTPHYSVGKGLTVKQAKQVLEAAEGHRLYAMYVLAATLGLRHGELLGLRWQDLDFDDNTVTPTTTLQRANRGLLLDRTKTEASEATIPLPGVTKRALLVRRSEQEAEQEKAGEVWHNEHGLVFTTEIGTPIDPRNSARQWEKLRAKAGFPTLRLHDLRHTLVSLLLSLKTPPHIVQAIARHANLDVTMTIYAHTNLDDMREALDKIDWDNA